MTVSKSQDKALMREFVAKQEAEIVEFERVLDECLAKGEEPAHELLIRVLCLGSSFPYWLLGGSLWPAVVFQRLVKVGVPKEAMTTQFCALILRKVVIALRQNKTRKVRMSDAEVNWFREKLSRMIYGAFPVFVNDDNARVLEQLISEQIGKLMVTLWDLQKSDLIHCPPEWRELDRAGLMTNFSLWQELFADRQSWKNRFLAEDAEGLFQRFNAERISEPEIFLTRDWVQDLAEWKGLPHEKSWVRLSEWKIFTDQNVRWLRNFYWDVESWLREWEHLDELLKLKMAAMKGGSS